MNGKKYHIVNRLKTVFHANVLGREVALNVSDCGKGVVGCILVFDSQESAQAYYKCKAGDMKALSL